MEENKPEDISIVHIVVKTCSFDNRKCRWGNCTNHAASKITLGGHIHGYYCRSHRDKVLRNLLGMDSKSEREHYSIYREDHHG
jgi:hypothetical protein